MNSIGKQIHKDQDATEVSTCGKSDCCNTTEDGNAVCVVSQEVASSNTAAPMIRIDSIETLKLSSQQPRDQFTAKSAESIGKWQRIRSVVMFGIACLASPCCTPVIVPVVLALLAGTPVALWLGENLGWVYGGLTLISIVSFVLGWRWTGKTSSHRAVSPGHQSAVPSKTLVKK